MATKRSSLPGAMPARTATSQVAPPKFIGEAFKTASSPADTFFQPQLYPDSLPFKISPIPEGGASPTSPEDPGTVLGVPPSAGSAQVPGYHQLSDYLTHPQTLVYVGAPLDASIVATGSATAPYAEIADAMAWIATQPAGAAYQVDVAPGTYAAFTVPVNRAIILRGTAFTVPTIAVAHLGVLIFVDVQTFNGTGPAITFNDSLSSNAVFFDSTSARAFGIYGGSIVNGTPICQGPGPYLAFTSSAIPAFYSVIGSENFIVVEADGALGSSDVDTLGVVYPASPGGATCVLVWPSGTVIPAHTGLVLGTPRAIYRAGNGSPTITPTTQPIGVDDGSRVFVNIRT